MIVYRLIQKENREMACESCKNRLPEMDCAVELAILNGMTVFESEIEYEQECDSIELKG